ncbi:MAG: hypothetical protein AB2745_08635 [Candidatus Thiodiazotropha endolucinida]
MKASITQHNSYSVTLEGIDHHDFEKLEEWEGMIKFRKKGTGEVIIVHKYDEPILEFMDIFGDRKDISEEFDIAKISPSLIPEPKENDRPDPGGTTDLAFKQENEAEPMKCNFCGSLINTNDGYWDTEEGDYYCSEEHLIEDIRKSPIVPNATPERRGAILKDVQWNSEGEIRVKPDSPEYNFLHDLYVNKKATTGALKEFGFPDTFVVVNMQMVSDPDFIAVFKLRSVEDRRDVIW